MIKPHFDFELFMRVIIEVASSNMEPKDKGKTLYDLRRVYEFEVLNPLLSKEAEE